MTADPQTTDPTGETTTETAHALLWRHGLPEDVIDGALALFAQELAGKIRAHRDYTRGAVQATKVMDFAADLISPENWARTVSALPVVRPELRDQIAALFRHPPGAERLGDATPGEIADAVLSVLPATTNRAAEEAYRLALSQALRLGTGANWEAIRDRAEDLVAEVAELTAAVDRAPVYRELADRQTQLAVADDLQRDRPMATARRQLVKELRRMAVEAQQQTETPAPGTEPGCTRCGHSRERHMGDEGERGCYTCWDLPGNSGWNHPFHGRDTDQPAVVAAVAGEEPAGAQRNPAGDCECGGTVPHPDCPVHSPAEEQPC